MRFGLFGTGHWAQVTQGAALAAHPEAELVGVWGRDPAKTAALAEELGVRPYADADALIADCAAVAVALPPDVQAPLAVRAARAGRHLLLDKPVSLTVADADEVVRAVADSGVASVVFFTARFDPEVSQALETAAAAGGWSSARVIMYGSIFAQGGPYAGSLWRREHGGLWDLGPHALSRLLPVLGPVAEVSALRGAQATSHVLARHDSGAVSVLQLTLDAPPAAQPFGYQLFGDAGVVDLPGGSGDPVVNFGQAIDELLAQVRSGRPGHPCDVRFAREVVAVLAAAQRSEEDGRTVAVR
ncbi:Gfo/Idh/MocA family protein [Catellatospora tritici]|uniref:Gfo/Idh/MocA family protein n=1 Tax=Catellatospora tritici TaxID=2851566 RepID=UPI001C2D80A9|nr:Gfo/Idh/MocA family oxidoreductase [Catellatospora tritici]MBV1850322.1 Gfo/Idh/MocA family oxidoreductase [Catellatospora tritici]